MRLNSQNSDFGAGIKAGMKKESIAITVVIPNSQPTRSFLVIISSQKFWYKPRKAGDHQNQVHGVIDHDIDEPIEHRLYVEIWPDILALPENGPHPDLGEAGLVNWKMSHERNGSNQTGIPQRYACQKIEGQSHAQRVHSAMGQACHPPDDVFSGLVIGHPISLKQVVTYQMTKNEGERCHWPFRGL